MLNGLDCETTTTTTEKKGKEIKRNEKQFIVDE